MTIIISTNIIKNCIHIYRYYSYNYNISVARALILIFHLKIWHCFFMVLRPVI